MAVRLIRVFFVVFFVFLFLLSNSTALKAEVSTRSEVMDEALMYAQSKPAEGAERAGLRQKLGTMVTEEEFTYEMDSYVRYMPARSLKAQPGEISIIDSESEYSHSFKLFDKLPIELSAVSRYISIDSKKNLPLFLPNKLTGVSFGGQVTLPFFTLDNTYLRFKVMPSFFSDNWDFKGESFRIPSYALAIYMPNDQWIFALGVAVYPRFENQVFPIGGVTYKPNDKLIFELMPPRPNITYALNDYISVFTEGGFSYDEFRVGKDGYRNAILSYNEAHVGGGLKFTANKNIEAYLSTGYMFDRRLQYRDSLGKASIKSDIYTELRVEMKI